MSNVAYDGQATGRELQQASGSDSHLKELAALKWRRVASTHKLEDLLETSKLDHQGPRLDLLCLGVATAAGAVAAFSAGTCAFWFSSSERPALAYYSQLMVAWLPATGLFVICNWFCMKLFKHNS